MASLSLHVVGTSLWPTLLLSSIYLVAASLPLLVPVARNLEYEYALILAIVLPIFVPIAICLIPKKYYSTLSRIYSHSLKALIHTFVIGPLILMVPAIVMFVTGSCACSRTGFVFWSLIQVAPSWIASQAIIIYIMRRHSRSKKPVVLVMTVALLFLILGLTGSLWFSPQKRIAHLLFGFIHGPIYDRLIEFDHGLLAVRIAHVFLAIVLWKVAQNIYQRTWWRGSLLWLGCWVIATVIANQYPSTQMGKGVLQEALPLKLEGEGFTFHYTLPDETQPAPSTTNSSSPKALNKPAVDKSGTANTNLVSSSEEMIKNLFTDTQFHIQELKQLFKLPLYPHVHVYVYPDRKTKKLWFGGNATDVTDVVTPSVHIAMGRWPHPTLRHELVHALTSDAAFHGLGFHPNMAFTEGLAMAMAPQAGNLSLHEGAYSLIQSGRIPDVEQLFSPLGFWSQSSQRAYTVVGSLVQYLTEKVGVEKLMQLYAGQDWHSTLAESPQSVLEDWRKYLSKQIDVSRFELVSEALYRFPGVLHDRCSHSKIDLKQPRASGLYFRLRQPLGWNPEIDYDPWLKRLHPQNQTPEFQNIYQEVKKLVNARPFNKEKLAEKQQHIQTISVWPPEIVEHVELALLNSDVLRLLGERSKSFERLQELRTFSSKKFLGDQLTREIEARYQIETNLRSSEALSWRKFLAGWDNIPDDTKGSHWMIDYLELRNKPAQTFSSKTLTAKLNETILVILPPTFYVEWYKRLAETFMQLKDYQNASKAYKKAANLASTAERDLLEEHSRRVSFYTTSRPTAQNH